MLLSFSVANFLSFYERQTLELFPDSLKDHPEHLHIPYLFDINTRLLKSVAIYGHNSSGKSNLLKAYKFFQDFVFTSFSFGKSEEIILIDNFKLIENAHNEPSTFEVVFLIREIKYRYGYTLTKERITSEWLYYSESKIRENYLFHRVGQEIKISRNWNKENNNKIDQAFRFTKKHQLLLSVLLFQDSIVRIDEIGKWLKSNIVIQDINDDEHLKKAILFLSHPQYRTTINKFIEKADFGFETIEEKIDGLTRNKLVSEKHFLNFLFAHEIQSFELYSKHNIYNKEKSRVVDVIKFELLKSESSGTIKYLILSAFLAYAIKEGLLIFIDELDSKFHPLLVQLLVKVYNSNLNTLGSQMIFTTHSQILLTNKTLRRDQFASISKNGIGESTLSKMHSPNNPLRIDTLLDKEFLNGDRGGASKKLTTDNLNRNTLFD